MEEDMEGNERLKQAVFENIPGGFFINEVSGEKRILSVNQQLLDIFECATREEFDALTGGTFPGMVVREDRSYVDASVWNQRYAGMDFIGHVSFRIRTASGKLRYVELYARLVNDPEDGELYYVYLVDADVRYLTYDTDHLTGLPGMRRFLDYAARFSRLNHISPHPIVYDYLYFNLAGFKTYNIRNGIAKGDEMLQSFARILASMFPNDMIARLGDDHFAVLTDDVSAKEHVEKVIDEVRSLTVESPLQVKVGIFREEKQENAQRAIDYAKLACDSIRSSLETHVCVYTAALKHRMLVDEYASAHIDEAIGKGYIKVYYQPVVRSLNHSAASLEALARWQDPDQGMLSPAEFIPSLEKSRQIWKLDAAMIREVCRNMHEQKQLGRPVIPVSFNLSRLDFILCDIFSIVEEAVEKYQIDRRNLSVEVTESLMTENAATVDNVLNRFRKAGYQIWIDDFGSGYSSLNVLKDYHFDVLKIDMAFLSSFTDTAKSIIQAVISMAKKIGIEPLAEGAETKEEVEFLENNGCALIQGYWYSKPLPYEECMKLLQERNLKPESETERVLYRKASMTDIITDLPEGIIEDSGDHIRFLAMNDAFGVMGKEYGMPEPDILETYMNKADNPVSQHLMAFLRKPRKKGVRESFALKENNLGIQINVRLLEQDEKRKLLLFSIGGTTNLAQM